jgi:AraC-like DNA-binding protein
MTSDSMPDILGPDAIIPLTGYYQFAAGEKVSQPQVQSRMFLWCKTGKGTVQVNGQLIPMQANDFCFLPWDRAIVYQADSRDPFMTGGIHIIPFHSRSANAVFQVAHSEQDDLFNREGRSDLPLGILDGIKDGSLNEATVLHHLAEYIVQRFRDRHPEEWEARTLAQLLLAQLSDVFHEGQRRDRELPLPLRQMMDFVEKHRRRKMGLKELARISGLGVSAVGRMFQRYLGITPIAFITRYRIDYAKHLLSGTRIQVAEIGCRVGIDDPYYFSKLFRKTTGVTPLEYRRKCSFL